MKSNDEPPVSLPVETASGIFWAHYSKDGLASLDFPPGPGLCTGGSPSPLQLHWHKRTAEAVLRTLAGQPVKALPPLDLSRGTTFQRTVWNVLLQIAPGQTLTYAEVAAKAGRPRASRAAGQACGRNPVPVLVPCHRVVAASRKLGGFSGGLDWKIELLKSEGVLL